MESLLRLENIYASVPGREILCDVSIDIKENEVLGLVGESGSGKTTTAQVINGLIKPDAGAVYLGSERLSYRRTKEQRRRIQTVFQDPDSSFNPRHTIGQTILDAMSFHFPGKSREELMRQCEENLRLMELPADTLSRYPRSLSGGQKQRAALMRALCVRPDLIIADEPTSALDVSVQLNILRLLKRIKEERKLGMLFISHDLGVINYICDRVALLKEGRIAEVQDRAGFFSAPATDYGRELLESVPDSGFLYRNGSKGSA